MPKNIHREKRVHGIPWSRLHGGYFSDPDVAAPLVRAIRRVLPAARPDAIVDLGGGTGFLLSELARRGVTSRIRLRVLDASPSQLRAIANPRVEAVHGSIARFRRTDVRRLLFVMRSVLHYHGRRGLAPVLRHIRAQMKRGELFVHQTACFESEADARCLNQLYERMETGKWYPTIEQLVRRLQETGWEVRSASPAPSLPLTSQELGRRYNVGPRRMAEIRQLLLDRFGEKKGVFAATRNGFVAQLHYRIFICVASS